MNGIDHEGQFTAVAAYLDDIAVAQLREPIKDAIAL
jgi:hypothetical protein